LIVLLFFAALRSPDVDRDYINYLVWFNEIASGGMTVLDWIKDPGFVVVSKLAAALGMSYIGATFMLVSLALVGMTWFARLACSERYFSFFIYLAFCRFFLAQEMTAIRAGVAIPLLSLAILYMYRDRKMLGMSCFLLGISFHLTVLVGLPVVILAMREVRFKSRWWMGSMIPVLILLRIAARNILETFSEVGRISHYLNGDVEIGSINFLSVYLLAHGAVLLFVVCFLWRKVSSEERLFIFCSGIGLSLQLLFSFNDTIALRGSELFGLFDMALFIIPLKYVRPIIAYTYALFLIICGAAFYASDLTIVQPYRWIFG
jgi:uncharacterized membrane protein